MHILKQTSSIWERSILSRERSGPEICYLRLLMIARSSIPSRASKLLCLCYAPLLYSWPAKSKTVSMWKTLSLLFSLFVFEVWGAEIFRVSSNPVRVFQGSDALFQWTLKKGLTSQPDFRGVVFGVWKNGYVASYLLSVTKNGWIVLNPDLKDEAPHLAGRMQWKGDLFKSIAAFQISHVSAQDQMEYGLRLEYGTLKGSQSDSLGLKVEADSAMSVITAAPSTPLSAAPGTNTSFQCEFRAGEQDKSVYDGITVGIWERGGIYLTLITLTKHEALIVNPKLDQEVPDYRGRVHAKTWADRSSNTSMMLVEIEDVRESDRRSYGCSMYFGPFKESHAASVWIGVQDHSKPYESQLVNDIPSHKSLGVRVGEKIKILCGVLSAEMQQNGAFKSINWKYCNSKNCNEPNTWHWLAGINNESKIKVTTEDYYPGPYENRVNLTLNGTLIINSVKSSDTAYYKCTVKRIIKYVSPLTYFVALKVNTTVRPKITSRRRGKVTAHEGNVLYLPCKAEGVPTPLVIWRKNEKIIQKRTNHTDFIHENATIEDGGVYVCEASNSVGYDSYMVHVVVKIIPVTELTILTIGPEEAGSKGLGGDAIGGIVASGVIFVIVYITIDYCCCLPKDCGLIFCCKQCYQARFQGGGRGGAAKASYANGKTPEGEKLTKDNPNV